MKIWAKKLEGTGKGRIEQIDECKVGEVAFMVREYQIAYGSVFLVWAGLRRDEYRTNGEV